MEQIDSIVKIFSAFSAIAVSLSSIIALLSVLFKPVRRAIAWIYKRIVGNKDKNEAVLKRIGDVENTLSTKIDGIKDGLERKIKEVSDGNDKNEKNRIRWEILNFANSCKNKRRHTQDEFKHIIELHDEYVELLAKTGEKNGFLDAEYDYLLRLYAEIQEKNDFL